MEALISWITPLRYSKLAPVATGLLLWLALPPVDWHWMVWVALVPLAWSLNHTTSPWRAAGKAWIAGFIFFLLNTFWIHVLSEWVGGMIYVGWFIGACYLALTFALWGGVHNRLAPRHPWMRALFGASLFALLELLRSSGQFGYPLSSLREALVPISPLLQLAAWTGGMGLTFLAVFVNLVLAEYADHPKLRGPVISMVTGVILLALLLQWEGHIATKKWESSSVLLRVGVVQGNIPQKEKMDPMARGSIFAEHLKLSQQLLQGPHRPELIVWPETAILAFLSHDPQFLIPIQQLARQNHVALLLGTPELGFGPSGTSIYNSLLLIDAKGRIAGRYDKEQLVPFGEYLPFHPLLYRFFQGTPLASEDFTPSREVSSLVYRNVTLIPAICFESTFDELVRQRVTAPASLIVVVTNDAWFHRGSILTEHLRHAQLRAVENREPLIQAANTGFSAYVSPTGKLLAVSQLEDTRTLNLEVRIGGGGSFYQNAGFLLFPAVLFLLVMWGSLTRLRAGE